MLIDHLLLLVFSAVCVSAVYQDEAFIVDWAKSNIGIVTDSVCINEYLGVLTSSNILATLDPNTGKELWRQPVCDETCVGSNEESQVNKTRLAPAFGSLYAVYYSNYLAVRNPLTSTIEWDTTFDAASPILGASSTRDLLLVAFSNKIVGLNAKGEIQWEHSLTEIPSAVLAEKSSFAIVSDKSITVYNAEGNAGGYVPFSGKLSSTRSDFVVVEEGINHNLAIYVLRDDKIHRIDASNVPSAASVARVDPNELKFDALPSFMYAFTHKQPIFASTATTSGSNMIVQFSNGDLSCYQLFTDETIWTRHEGLANVVDVVVYDLESKPLVSQEELTHEERSSLLTAFFGRAQRHLSALRNSNLLSWLRGSLVDNEAAKREMFGFNKMILVLSPFNELYALHSLSGEIKYSVPVGPVASNIDPTVKPVRATGLVRLGDVVYVYGKEFVTELTLNPSDGTIVSSNEYPLSVPGSLESIEAIDSETLAFWPSDNSGPVLNREVSQETYLTEWIRQSESAAEFGENTIQGYMIPQYSDKPVKTYTYKPETGYKIVAVAKKDPRDVSASLGKVLGDRSVLYKYLHPNVMAIAEVGDAPMHSLKVTIIDTVTGRVLHTRTHESDHVLDTSSVHLVFGENWIVYSYDSIHKDILSQGSSEASQVTVWDLYESNTPNERASVAGEYSSFAVPRPFVEAQSFFVPQRVKQLAISHTKLGITLRDILMYTEAGQIIAVPKPMLDARRPHLEPGQKPSQAMIEEGLIPYDSVLAPNARSVISHSRQILGVKSIITGSTAIESTSIVLAYGSLDLFYTRITPSGPFDMLTPNFEKIKLLMTIAVLVGVVMILSPMVSRKKTNAEWR